MLTPAATALADGSTAGADVPVALSLGGRELAVVLRPITSIPGPLHIDVISHADRRVACLSYLAQHLHEVPVLVIPRLRVGDRFELESVRGQAGA